MIKNTHLEVSDLKTFEDFKISKNSIIQNLFDIEDDMKQSAQALRLQYKQNQDLIDQIKNMELELTRNNTKFISAEKYHGDLIKKIQDLTQEKLLMKEKEYSLKNEIARLQTIIKEERTVFNNISLQHEKEKEFLQKVNSTNISLNNSTINKRELGPIISAQNPQYAENKIVTQNNRNTNIESNEVKDLKNIIDSRQKSKQLLNDVLKDHLGRRNEKEGYLGNKGYLEDEREQQQGMNNRYSNMEVEEGGNLNNNNENKPEKISNIILKLNSNKQILTGIINKFGGDIFQKLFSGNADSDFLQDVEYEIRLIETSLGINQPQKSKFYPSDKEDNYKKIKAIIENEIVEEKEENEEEISKASKNKQQQKNKNERGRDFSPSDMNKSVNLKKANISTLERSQHPFEKSLRKNTDPHLSRQDEKKFVNYTKTYGSFFDKNLQMGGGIGVDSSQANIKSISNMKKSFNSDRSLGIQSKIDRSSKIIYTKPEESVRGFYKRDYDNGWKTTKDYFEHNSDSENHVRNKSIDKIVNKANI